RARLSYRACGAICDVLRARARARRTSAVCTRDILCSACGLPYCEPSRRSRGEQTRRGGGAIVSAPRDYYERYWSEDGYLPVGISHPALHRLLESHVSSSARCLDLGCGDGRTAGLWLSRHAET